MDLFECDPGVFLDGRHLPDFCKEPGQPQLPQSLRLWVVHISHKMIRTASAISASFGGGAQKNVIAIESGTS